MAQATSGSGGRSLPEIKEQIKERADLVEIIGRYTKLQKMGGRYIGCCPFHKEKTPSFNVNPQQGFYHCFGCKEGGDVFAFLMKVEGLSFMEAMRDLAQSLHIEIPQSARFSAEASREATTERSAGHELLERAAKFYNKVLLTGATEGARKAWAYLQTRGITQEEAEELRLGWAPESGQDLMRKLSASEKPLAEKTSLIRMGQSGPYEFFRSRLLIPICDAKGRTAAFSGRTLEPVTSQNPKYKNSSESDWFKKKEVLYGLDRAAKLIRTDDYVCIVEGYFDQWAFHRNGIPAVAVMGTALTEEHLKVLGRYTKRVVLVLDADRAGIESTLKAIPALVRGGWNVTVFSGIEGKDPDEWLASEKVDDLKKKMLAAPEALEWWIRLILEEAIAQRTPRYETYKKLSAPWSFTQTQAHRSVLADEIGRMIGISSDHVLTDLNELVRNSAEVTKRSGGSSSGYSSNEDSSSASRQSPTLSSSLSETPLTRSASEEVFVWWVRHADILTPMTEEDWAKRVELFSRTPVEAGVIKLREVVGETGSANPVEWLEKLDAEPLLKTWIQKGLVLRDDPEVSQNEAKVLISFNEISSILVRERVHSDIARVQAQIRKLGSTSPETPGLLQKVQQLRFQLEKTK